MSTKTWFMGLLSAVISGAATSITMVIVDPQVFNFQEGIGKVGMVALVSGIVSAANYLKQSPLPTAVENKTE